MGATINMTTFNKSKKTKRVVEFFSGLEHYLENHKRLPKNTGGKSESSIQGQLYSIFAEYLEKFYSDHGLSIQASKLKAAQNLYWEGDNSKKARIKRQDIFRSRNYPDFHYYHPYSIAIEYKQGSSGSLIKQGIGQSMVHILNEEYAFVYLLFNDQSKGKTIKSSMKSSKEKFVKYFLWNNFNIYLHLI